MARIKRKVIDKNTELVIKNNTHGMFYWESPNKSTVILLENHGDEEFLTYGELKTMFSQMRPYLTSMGIIIAEVVDSEDLTVLDIAEGLRIGQTYRDFFENVADLNVDEDIDSDTVIDPEDFEAFIEDCETDEFTKAIQTSMRKALIEAAVSMYKQHRLSDYNKMTAIQKTRTGENAENFWNDISSTFSE